MTMKSLCLSLAGVAALGLLAAPAPAQESQDQGKKSEQIIIVKREGPQTGEGGEHAMHRFRIERMDGSAAACTGQKDEVNEASADGRERTRIMICGDSQLSAADRAAKLEKVLSRIEARDDMSADQKARVTTALRGAIDRIRAGQ